jgi:hypothetical protein
LKVVAGYLIREADRDEDGLLTGPKHGLDADISGCDGWMGSLYLAAMAAMQRMAELQDDDVAARRYCRICRSGSKKQDALLFNGEYYIQRPDDKPAEDYNTGCHIDQVLGQWWANQLNLGWVYPRDHVRRALRSLFRYNYRTGFGDVETYRDRLPRKFVLDDDRGMVLTTWPRGQRPEPPHVVRFADEVMSGFEYSAAAAMIQCGLVREALAVVHATANRYDGRRRTGLAEKNGCAAWGYSGNPFGDDECGKFYARAMSSWSLLLACQGFQYNGPAASIGFQPVWQPDAHTSFFTAAEGWGVYDRRRDVDRQVDRLDLRYGRLPLRRLVLGVPATARADAAVVRQDGVVVDASAQREGERLHISFAEPVVIEAGQALQVEVPLQ